MAEPGNDRAREEPNPGSSEPGKFGLGACLNYLTCNAVFRSNKHVLISGTNTQR
jgi:hypothetical protein